MNDEEKEILILNSVLDAASDLMSALLITAYKNAQGFVTEVKPKDYLEKRLFSIILLEMISPLDNTLFKGKQKTALEYLIEIGQSPMLGGKRGGKRIAKVASNFLQWLDKEFNYEFDSTVGKRVHVKFTRKEVIYFCGNQNKHFGFRLGAVVRKMTDIYTKSGISVSSGIEPLKLLEDVQTWLYDDVFAYHFTKICEYIAAVDAAIMEYLAPVYRKRFKNIGGTFYRYVLPRKIKSEFSKNQYYELLNKFRNKNAIEQMKFKTQDWLEKKY